MNRHRHFALFGWVLVLPVTSLGSHKLPAVALDQLDDISDLHTAPNSNILALSPLPYARVQPQAAAAAPGGNGHAGRESNLQNAG